MNSLWEDALLAPRRSSSVSKKGMFSSEEGPFLVPSLRPFWMERGVVSEISQHFCLSIGCSLFYYLSFNRVNLTNHNSYNTLCSLSAGGLLWVRNVSKQAPWTLWALWEKKIPSTSPFAPFSGNMNSIPSDSIVYTRKAVTSDEVTACVCLREKSLTSR